jgi:uncharacterized membrane protein YdjX (TVP38/TMEM64 family)
VLGWALLASLLLGAILIPFWLFEDTTAAWAERLVRSPHARAVVALGLGGLLAADVVLPIPSSIVNTAAGSMLGFFAGTAVAWAGMTVGCAVGYRIGRGAARAGLGRIVGPGEVERASAAFARYGAWALVLMRPVPVLAEASVIVAGFHDMPRRSFHVLCGLSNLGIAAVYAAVGAWAVDSASFFAAFAGAVLLPGLAMLVSRPVRGRWLGRSGRPT